MKRPLAIKVYKLLETLINSANRNCFVYLLCFFIIDANSKIKRMVITVITIQSLRFEHFPNIEKFLHKSRVCSGLTQWYQFDTIK